MADENQKQNAEMQEYTKIRDSLKDIEDKITNEDLDMDESLKLYEEAVNLGMKASQTIENNVLVNVASQDEAEDEAQSQD